MHQIEQFNSPDEVNRWMNQNVNKFEYVDLKYTTLLVVEPDPMSQTMKQIAIGTFVLVYETIKGMKVIPLESTHK